MSENGGDRPGADQAPAAKSGWWWRFVALFMGVPPVAVYGAEDEVDAERSGNAQGRAGGPGGPHVTE